MKKFLLFILSVFAVFLLSACNDSSDSGKNKSSTVNIYPPSVEDPLVEVPSSKALTPNNVAAVTNEYSFPLLWRVDGKADDVLVFVKDGRVLDKVSEYYTYDNFFPQNTTPVIDYYVDSTADQRNKLLLATTVGNLTNIMGYNLIGSKIVKVGSDVTVIKNAPENTLTGAEDVISFAEMIQGYATVEEDSDAIGKRYLNFKGKLFNYINANVTVNGIPVHSDSDFAGDSFYSIEISAEVPYEPIVGNFVEQGGMTYATYAGRVIQYPRLIDYDPYNPNNGTAYNVIIDTMYPVFNTDFPQNNYTFWNYSGKDTFTVTEITDNKIVLYTETYTTHQDYEMNISIFLNGNGYDTHNILLIDELYIHGDLYNLQ